MEYRLRISCFLPVLALLAGLVPNSVAAQSDYPYGFPLPGDCDALFQAGYGTAAKPLWYGRYSGRYIDIFDRKWPLFSAGCFPDERTCRQWTNGVLSYATEPGTMSCKAVTEGQHRKYRTVIPNF